MFPRTDGAGSLGNPRAGTRRAKGIFSVQDDEVVPLVGPNTAATRAAEPLREDGPFSVTDCHGGLRLRRRIAKR